MGELQHWRQWPLSKTFRWAACRIAEIELEMGRTQKNKATEYHLGQLKARLAKLRTELQEGNKKVCCSPMHTLQYAPEEWSAWLPVGGLGREPHTGLHDQFCADSDKPPRDGGTRVYSRRKHGLRAGWVHRSAARAARTVEE